MSITTVYSVFCNGFRENCINCEGWIAEADSISSARLFAKQHGWRFMWYEGKYLDICKNCLEEGMK